MNSLKTVKCLLIAGMRGAEYRCVNNGREEYLDHEGK